MANPEHLEILKQGVKVWNKWRLENPERSLEIIRDGLVGIDLRGEHLDGADFTSVNFARADFDGANLEGAIFSRANLVKANFRMARLERANFSNADLTRANFTGAFLSDAILCNASLGEANLTGARLDGTDLSRASVHDSIFADIDLSQTIGLGLIRHIGPSPISIETLYLSEGNIPEEFLRGCGIPDDFITFIPSHFGIQQAIQFYSCFISYSTNDEEFARRLYSRMRDEKLRVWFAPEDIKGGQKLHEQIERAIQMHDRLLIVLSENSMQSEWVMTEIRRARKTEIEENRRKLFPIRLVDFNVIRQWKCFGCSSQFA